MMPMRPALACPGAVRARHDSCDRVRLASCRLFPPDTLERHGLTFARPGKYQAPAGTMQREYHITSHGEWFAEPKLALNNWEPTGQSPATSASVRGFLSRVCA